MRTKGTKSAPSLSIDELVAAIKRSNLTTVLVEGRTDLEVYRWLEGYLSDQAIDVLQCGGRDRLLEVFSRSQEFPERRVVFVADQDMWLFSSIPEQYRKGILFTKGYSLENDVYSKSVIEKLFETEEASEFESTICELSKWFAFVVEKHLASDSSALNFPHVNEICPSRTLCPMFASKIGYSDAKPETIGDIQTNYSVKLRGKTLFEAVLRFLSKTSRKSKYSNRNLLEMCVKLDSPPIIDLCRKIKAKAALLPASSAIQPELMLKPA